MEKHADLESSAVAAPTELKIKHLVLSGGGMNGYIAFGILKESNLLGFWDIKEIESVHATSIGAINGLILLLNFEWEVIEKYLTNMPLDALFDLNFLKVANSYKNCGICGNETVINIFTPLFKTKNIDLNITMLEFYNLNKIDFHIYATEYNNFKHVDISHKTHPEWKLLDAIYCSSCLPILYKPFKSPIDGKLYIDGAFFCNYPLYHCFQNNKHEKEKIFGINLKYIFFNENNTLFDYLFYILDNVIDKNQLSNEIDTSEINEISLENINTDEVDNDPFTGIYLAIIRNEKRIKMIEKGKNVWNEWWSKKNQSPCGGGSGGGVGVDPTFTSSG